MIALVVVLTITALACCGLAWWRGYEQGYCAAMAYRKVAAEVDASTFPVEDGLEGIVA
jgi:hypothetical protein